MDGNILSKKDRSGLGSGADVWIVWAGIGAFKKSIKEDSISRLRFVEVFWIYRGGLSASFVGCFSESKFSCSKSSCLFVSSKFVWVSVVTPVVCRKDNWRA